MWVFIVEIILVCILIFNADEGVGGIGPLIISFPGLLIVYPIALIMNIRAIKATHSTYLYIPLCVNILPPAAFIVYSFFRSIS